MSSARKKLQEIADRLDYPNFKRRYCRITEDTYGKRRAVIGSYLWDELKITGISVEDRDQLRRYFDAKYEITQTEINKYGDIPSVWSGLGGDEYAIKLYDTALVLENDGDFYRAYKRLTFEQHAGDRRNLIALTCRRLKLYTPHGAFYEQLRRYFDDTMDVNNCVTAGDSASYAKDPDIKFWLEAVRYPPAPPTPPPKEKIIWKDELEAARAAGATLQIKEGGVWIDEAVYRGRDEFFNFAGSQARYRVKPPNKMTVDELAVELTPTPTPKETSVSKPITITTTTFANGNDISKMADGEIFNMIAEQEAEIEALKKIKAQPKKLVEEIAKREAGIVALVAYLDSAKA